MTAAVIKKSELKATREKRQKKLNERQQNEKKKVSPFKDRKQKPGLLIQRHSSFTGKTMIVFPNHAKNALTNSGV